MPNPEKTRRNFLANTAVIAALGASTSRLFGDATPATITDNAIEHAERLAGIEFTSSEREQMMRTGSANIYGAEPKTMVANNIALP